MKQLLLVFQIRCRFIIESLIIIQKSKENRAEFKNQKMAVKICALFFCKDRTAILHKIAYGPNGKVMKTKRTLKAKYF